MLNVLTLSMLKNASHESFLRTTNWPWKSLEKGANRTRGLYRPSPWSLRPCRGNFSQPQTGHPANCRLVAIQASSVLNPSSTNCKRIPYFRDAKLVFTSASSLLPQTANWIKIIPAPGSSKLHFWESASSKQALFLQAGTSYSYSSQQRSGSHFSNRFLVEQPLQCSKPFSIHKLVPPSASANWFLKIRSWFSFAAANWFSFSILKLDTLQEPQTGSSCSASLSWFLFCIRKLVPLQKPQTVAYKQVLLQHLQTGSHFSSAGIHKLVSLSASANWFPLQHPRASSPSRTTN